MYLGIKPFLPKELTILFSNFADETLCYLELKPKTKSNYRSMYRNHIKPILGDREIESIKRLDIQKVIFPLRPQTAAMTLAVMRAIFREAITNELIERSPAEKITRPRIRVRVRKFLTVEELQLENLGKYERQIMFLAMHGLRWGEAVALTPQDIENGRVNIMRSVHGETKTAAGVRSVPLLSPFVAFPKSPKPLRNVLNPLGIHIHSLRHTYAYLLKSTGVHVTTAQKLMGHSDPKVTLGIYTHFRDQEIEEAGALIRSKLNLATVGEQPALPSSTHPVSKPIEFEPELDLPSFMNTSGSISAILGQAS